VRVLIPGICRILGVLGKVKIIVPGEVMKLSIPGDVRIIVLGEVLKLVVTKEILVSKKLLSGLLKGLDVAQVVR